MLLNTLMKNIKDIVASIEVKMPYCAKMYETLEIRKAADLYYSAYNGYDSFTSYSKYYLEAIRYGLSQINITLSDYEIAPFVNEPNKIESYLKTIQVSDSNIKLCKDFILKKQRELTVANYEEQNNYYRKIIGLPPIESTISDYIRLSNSEYIESGTRIDIGDEYVIKRASLYNPNAYRYVITLKSNGIDSSFTIPSFVNQIDSIFISNTELNSVNYDFNSSTSTIEFKDFIPQNNTDIQINCFIEFTTDDITPLATLILSYFTVKNNGRLKNEIFTFNNKTYNLFKLSTSDTNFIRLSNFKYLNNILYFDFLGNYIGIYVNNNERDINNNDNHSAIPIKYIHTEKNINKLYRLESRGVLNAFKAAYPNTPYLNYISATASVDLLVARHAQPFSIIRINKQVVPEGFLNQFTTIYNQCREYFSIVIYNQDLAGEYKYYDNFIGLSIMVMTIQRVIAESFKSGIQRDFYDWDFIQKMYKLYKIPFTETLPMEYHITILKNLNNLLRYKSTDKVLYNLIDLLGYQHLNVYRYFLIREQKLDENEKPRFFYKLDSNGDFIYDEYGKPEIDYDKTFDIYFQAIDIAEPNVLLSLNDVANRYEYEDVINSDPYWQDDGDLEYIKNGIGINPEWMRGKELLKDIDKEDNSKKTYDAAYNYVETKYIGLSTLYDMTEVFFEFMYAYSMVLNKKEEIDRFSDVFITLPKLDNSNSEFSIVDTVIFTMSLMMKLRYVDIDNTPIPTTPSQVSGIYKMNFNEENLNRISELVQNKTDAILGNTVSRNNDVYKYQINSAYFTDNSIRDIPYENTEKIVANTYGFNFSEESIKIASDIISADSSISRDIKDYFEDGLKIESSEDINKLFAALKEYKTFLTNKISNATSVSEYNFYKAIYNVTMISEVQSDTFTYKDADNNTISHTYGSYMSTEQPILYGILNNIQYDDITTAIEHVFGQIKKALGESIFEYDYVVTGDLSPVLRALVSLITFFKSYTVDLASYNIIFMLDSKIENRIRQYEQIKHQIKKVVYNDTLNGLYSDSTSIRQTLRDSYTIERKS